ncbi:MAG: DUF3160 domain-containing protein, partial [Oscillospiraceae bacterium]|nr:DUF3160 domain-containing protein [Oscillospiraceae bacterium]
MAFIIENDLLVKYEQEPGAVSVTVPDTVTGIGQRAFQGCTLETILLPETVTRVETGAFAGCARLREMRLPAGVNAVYSLAFEGCAALERVVLPENLQHYGEHVFRGCEKLTRMESPDGRVVLTCEDLEKTGIRFAIPEDYTNQAQIGLYLDAVCKSSCRLTVVSAETGETLYQLWIAFDKETPELQQAVRALFYDTYDYDFARSDSYFRSMKSTRNKAMYAFLRLKYPYQLGDEYAILFRNFLKRFATNALSFFIDDDTPEELAFAEQIGMFEKADFEELIDYSREMGKEDFAQRLTECQNRRDSGAGTGVHTLTPAQIKKLNEPVFQRLQEKKARLRRAAEERLARTAGNETLISALIENVKADDRAAVCRLLADGADVIDRDTLVSCCRIAVENDDSYMLQELFEAMPALDGTLAADMLEAAVIAGNLSTVKFLCVYAKEINPYNRALGYTLRQANYEMAKAILSRDDQMLKSASYIKNVYKSLGEGPELEILKSRLVDVQYLEYNYYDDDFRYILLNCSRNGLIGDEFYDIYEMNRYYQIPSFVTTDSMMHTYHLYFSHLMKNTERNYLSESLRGLASAMLQKSEAQLSALTGTEWEDAALKNTAFFAVGCSLLDPSTQVPAQVQDLVNAELALIGQAAGVSDSPIFSLGSDAPVMEDYSQYIVRGYYEGDAQLEP